MLFYEKNKDEDLVEHDHYTVEHFESKFTVRPISKHVALCW